MAYKLWHIYTMEHYAAVRKPREKTNTRCPHSSAVYRAMRQENESWRNNAEVKAPPCTQLTLIQSLALHMVPQSIARI